MSRPVVTTKQGDLRGVEIKSVVGGSYISFKGIPYATPPVGDLRFRDPQPPQPWTGIRDAIEEGNVSPQFDMFTRKYFDDDDCLYLNVATPALTGSRPVMVWIHGGAWAYGNGGSGMFGPDYLMGSEIVFVGINYRLGVLGFLHLDDEVVPGNMGLKDQVAALKWVTDNISQFGGNPNNVTIFGESAGAASTHYLLLSPLAKGLFHKAIMQSIPAWIPFTSTSQTIDTARRLVSALGRDITDPKEIVKYLRTVPVRRLIEAQESLTPPDAYAYLALPFAPTVDDKSVEPMIPRPIEELVAKGFDVPIILGYTSDEGVLYEIIFEHIDNACTNLDKNFEKALPQDLVAKAPSKIPEIIREIKKFYFKDKPITKDVLDEIYKYYRDTHYAMATSKVVDIQQEKKSPFYLYRFSYDNPNSVIKIAYGVKGKGAMHCDETQYMFYPTQFGEHVKMRAGRTEKIIRDRIVRMWTDFAKTGNPTPKIDDLITEKWQPVTKTSRNYLNIDAKLTAGVNPDEESFLAWKRFYAMADDQ